jgi:hypothetical protein
MIDKSKIKVLEDGGLHNRFRLVHYSYGDKRVMTYLGIDHAAKLFEEMLTDYLDGEEFYSAMHNYRLAQTIDHMPRALNEVKRLIRMNHGAIKAPDKTPQPLPSKKPVCADCRYAHGVESLAHNQHLLCINPAAGVDIINGGSNPCSTERSVMGVCGMNGLLFESKQALTMQAIPADGTIQPPYEARLVNPTLDNCWWAGVFNAAGCNVLRFKDKPGALYTDLATAQSIANEWNVSKR